MNPCVISVLVKELFVVEINDTCILVSFQMNSDSYIAPRNEKDLESQPEKTAATSDKNSTLFSGVNCVVYMEIFFFFQRSTEFNRDYFKRL